MQPDRVPCTETTPLSAQALFKALADETRLNVMLLVTREKELCVCELVQALQQSQPKISRHLKLLRDMELLEDRRQGIWIYYRLHPDLPEWVCEILATTVTARSDQLQIALQRLKEMGDRPQRQTNCC